MIFCKRVNFGKMANVIHHNELPLGEKGRFNDGVSWVWEACCLI